MDLQSGYLTGENKYTQKNGKTWRHLLAIHIKPNWCLTTIPPSTWVVISSTGYSAPMNHHVKNTEICFQKLPPLTGRWLTYLVPVAMTRLMEVGRKMSQDWPPQPMPAVAQLTSSLCDTEPVFPSCPQPWGHADRHGRHAGMNFSPPYIL